MRAIIANGRRLSRATEEDMLKDAAAFFAIAGFVYAISELGPIIFSLFH